MRNFLLISKILIITQGLTLDEERCPVARLTRRAMAHSKDDKELDCTFNVDLIEKVGTSVNLAWQRHGSLTEVLVGLALVFHGAELTTSFLFLETLREVGGPQLKRSGTELFEHWTAANKALREEIPNLRAMQNALQKLQAEAKELRSALRKVKADAADGIIDKEDFIRYEAEIKAEFQDVLRAASRVHSTTQPLRRVVEAFDLASVQNILYSTWNTILACLATYSSNKAANLGLGLGLASDFDDIAKQPTTAFFATLFSLSQKRQDDPLADVSSPILTKIAHGTFDASARLGAILFAFKNQQFVLTLSAIALGSRLFATGTHRLLTICRTGTIPPRQKPNQIYIGKAILATAIGTAGVVFQLRRGAFSSLLKSPTGAGASSFLSPAATPMAAKSFSFRSPLRFVLAPAFALDRTLKRYSPPPSPSTIVGGSGGPSLKLF